MALSNLQVHYANACLDNSIVHESSDRVQSNVPCVCYR